jgi:hypothetical protein
MYEQGCEGHHVLGFVPGDNGRKTNLPHAREDGKGCEYERRPYPLVLIENIENAESLAGCQYFIQPERSSTGSRR